MAHFKVDTAHSHVGFAIQHMMVNTLKGQFHDYQFEIEGDLDQPTSLQAKGTIQVNSIDTYVRDRDDHLQSEDFFDAKQYPEIKFTTKAIEPAGDHYKAQVEVTFKGHTQDEEFELYVNGSGKNPLSGDTNAGFTLKGELNREDYGLTYNAPLETGGVFIGKKVKIELNLETVVEG
ncbi:hypothetical protein HMPREF1208_01521 [Staphylococcus sp. HGB0015]|uniref:YceI family protein n=1 Tax=Staphylococcus TaxID=1279 RepID=UPI00034E530F|nr:MULTISPECIES: YceI family protein [Staphylococcus]EPD49985.1 hypothetical protein HMPREF1208_01521 [Staphylococcus sp. HGB0015]NHA38075.1 polyisoprenoid-binding protein [Staphylococcus schleiferi]NHA40747.1 polyisoprenoid-binding protein [Staphylococcus schleiferi]